MQVSYKWLSEYLDLADVSPQQLADILTLGGLEVELVIEPGKEIDGLVVGKVLALEPVQGSDKLKVTHVMIDPDEKPLQIVCGAPNVEKGQKVVVAKVGAVLPEDFKIKPAKLMGIHSEGMICALDELGFSDSIIPKYDEAGIFILPEDATIGDDAKGYLGLDDAIIDIDITPNRADALSLRGAAYDAAALLNRSLHFEPTRVEEQMDKKIKDYIKVSAESKKDTLDYRMRIVENVTLTKSPLWMQRKLMSAGIRPIDVLVDITNYVMLEFGQPLHAFDYDKLPEKEIVVRRAHPNETIETLDGKCRQLNEEQLLITSGNIPVAVAGVMGGTNTEITSSTKTVAIEAAAFHPALTRRSAAALNMRSESSARFEKGINMQTVQEALDFAAQLMADLAGGKVVQGTAMIDAPEAEDVIVPITHQQMKNILGIDLALQEVVEILDRLRFKHELDGEHLLVSIPPRRWDITIAEDVAEEIARIYGYNNIPRTLPQMKTVPGKLTDEQMLMNQVKHYLESVGLTEAISYSLHTEEAAKKFQKEALGEAVRLMNPMSVEHSTLQQNMIVGLLENARYNRARHTKTIAQYEVGRVFYKCDDAFYEPTFVGGLVSVGDMTDTWQKRASTVDFYWLKGIVEGLLALRPTGEDVSFKATGAIEEMHPGRTAEIYLGEHFLGFIGQIHPQVAADYDLKAIYAFQINMEEWLKVSERTIIYEEISKYPSVTQDIALLVDRDVTHEHIVDIIWQAGKVAHLVDVHLFDLYEGHSIESGKKSLAYSLTFTNKAATLTDEQVKQAMTHIIKALTEQVHAEIR
ncbi:phenylalanine--tRNA ligase subunit beta [Allofustis seminis]|uniref:phenylalanine--tRNA ligase subunit beta n=1 Tax=Allofustis seminis TaxID=166939 RepID=UPI0003711C35|nr:phenylalanine--tRNA ligase subunit beta [Allofustis seminis]